MAVALLARDVRGGLALCHALERQRPRWFTVALVPLSVGLGRSQSTASMRPSSGGRGRRQPPGVAHVCFQRMRSSACRCRMDAGGLSPSPSSERRRAPLRTTALIAPRRGTGRLQGRHDNHARRTSRAIAMPRFHTPGLCDALVAHMEGGCQGVGVGGHGLGGGAWVMWLRFAGRSERPRVRYVRSCSYSGAGYLKSVVHARPLSKVERGRPACGVGCSGD